MTVTRVVTGVLRAPDGAHFANKTLVWFRANRKPAAQGGVVIVDEAFPVQTNSNGAITASIVPGLYLVQVRLKDADRLFQVAIPEGTGSFDIADGVDTAAPPITPIELAEARAARDLAVESAQTAASWATNPVDVPVEPGQFSARHHASKAAADRALSETARITTEAARADAQSARDAAFANAGVFADLAAGRAAVADGGQFMVAGPDEIIRYRRDSASTQTELSRYPTLGRIDNALIDPFSENRFGLIYALRPDDYVAPTSGVTLGLGQVSIAPTGRLFVRTALATVGASVGATLRVAFRRISGAGQPIAIRFLNVSNALVLSVPFAPRGGWWVAEEIVPVGTTQINVDYTNATGAAVVLTPLRASVPVALRETMAPDRARITGLLTDTGAIADLWPGVATVATTVGPGTPVINADGTVTVPAGANVEVRPADGLIVRAVIDVVSVLVQLTSSLVRSVAIKPIGATSGTSFFPARHIGDCWWHWSGALAVAGQTAIKNIFLVIDNRAQSQNVYTPAAVVVQKVIIVDGAEIPARLPAPAADTFPDDELVLTQSAGAIQIAQRAGEPAKYIRWSLTRYDDPASPLSSARPTAAQATTAPSAGRLSPNIWTAQPLISRWPIMTLQLLRQQHAQQAFWASGTIPAPASCTLTLGRHAAGAQSFRPAPYRLPQKPRLPAKCWHKAAPCAEPAPPVSQQSAQQGSRSHKTFWPRRKARSCRLCPTSTRCIGSSSRWRSPVSPWPSMPGSMTGKRGCADVGQFAAWAFGEAMRAAGGAFRPRSTHHHPVHPQPSPHGRARRPRCRTDHQHGEDQCRPTPNARCRRPPPPQPR